MNDVTTFLGLPIEAQAAVVCFVACATCLLALLLFAPQRDCFFLRWSPERRLLALLISPTLLLIWPLVLYALFLRSRGIGPNDLDFDD